jgi:hypothetical protein
LLLHKVVLFKLVWRPALFIARPPERIVKYFVTIEKEVGAKIVQRDCKWRVGTSYIRRKNAPFDGLGCRRGRRQAAAVIVILHVTN